MSLSLAKPMVTTPITPELYASAVALVQEGVPDAGIRARLRITKKQWGQLLNEGVDDQPPLRDRVLTDLAEMRAAARKSGKAIAEDGAVAMHERVKIATKALKVANKLMDAQLTKIDKWDGWGDVPVLSKDAQALLRSVRLWADVAGVGRAFRLMFGRVPGSHDADQPLLVLDDEIPLSVRPAALTMLDQGDGAGVSQVLIEANLRLLSGLTDEELDAVIETGDMPDEITAA